MKPLTKTQLSDKIDEFTKKYGAKEIWKVDTTLKGFILYLVDSERQIMQQEIDRLDSENLELDRELSRRLD